MKRILISSLALTLMAGGAMAQQAPAPAGAKAAPPAAAMPASGPTPAPGLMGADAGAPPPPPPGGPGAAGGPGAQLPPPPPPPRGAHFRLTRGDATLDVKCADGESMKSCSDIALQLLDKLEALPAGTTTVNGSSAPAPATP